MSDAKKLAFDCIVKKGYVGPASPEGQNMVKGNKVMTPTEKLGKQLLPIKQPGATQ